MDFLIGKLRAIFTSAGLGGVWDDNLGTGNPASHRSVKAYLQAVKEEQARARVRPKKTTPLFLDKLQQISQFIVSSIRKSDNSPIVYTFLLVIYVFSQSISLPEIALRILVGP